MHSTGFNHVLNKKSALSDEGADFLCADSNGVAVNFEEIKVITVKNRQMVFGFK